MRNVTRTLDPHDRHAPVNLATDRAILSRSNVYQQQARNPLLIGGVIFMIGRKSRENFTCKDTAFLFFFGARNQQVDAAVLGGHPNVFVPEFAFDVLPN